MKKKIKKKYSPNPVKKIKIKKLIEEDQDPTWKGKEKEEEEEAT